MTSRKRAMSTSVAEAKHSFFDQIVTIHRNNHPRLDSVQVLYTALFTAGLPAQHRTSADLFHDAFDSKPFLFRSTLRLDEPLRTLQEAEGAIGLLQNKENRHWVAYRRAGHSWLKLDSLADRPQEYPEARLFESFTKYPTYAVLLQE